MLQPKKDIGASADDTSGAGLLSSSSKLRKIDTYRTLFFLVRGSEMTDRKYWHHLRHFAPPPKVILYLIALARAHRRRKH